MVPISDCFWLLKHLAIRIGNPNLNTNLVQFLIIFFTCLLICLPNLQVLIVPKWNKKRGIYVLSEKKNAKENFQRNECTKYLFFLKQRAIWFKISDIKSQTSQMIMETNDVNFSQYAYICMTFRVEIWV